MPEPTPVREERQLREDEVAFDRVLEDEPLHMTVLRHEGDAARDGFIEG